MKKWFVAGLLVFSMNAGAGAQSPTGWSPIVLPTGTYRDCIKATPIEQRPGRLLHVYGNTVRMIDQYTTLRAAKPLRQVFLGTTSLRCELASR
ncbi:MAG: hypothetical protein AAFU85_20210 [Planctomycetota bacterium]